MINYAIPQIWYYTFDREGKRWGIRIHAYNKAEAEDKFWAQFAGQSISKIDCEFWYQDED